MSGSDSTDDRQPEELSSSSPDDEEDSALRILNARRMIELRKQMNRRLAAQQKAEAEKKRSVTKEPTDRDVVAGSLRDRGDEVLAAAEASYPRETALIIPKIAELIRGGKVSDISGGELLQFFRAVGMRVSVKTTISVQDHGKFIDIAEKIKRQNEQ